MDATVYCPTCKIEFEAERWENGTCPQCKKEYWWDEQCSPDYSECWSVIEWE